MAYLERNTLFNFDKTALGYVKTAMDSPTLSISFQNYHRRLRNFYRSIDYANDNSWRRWYKMAVAFKWHTNGSGIQWIDNKRLQFDPPPTTDRWRTSRMEAQAEIFCSTSWEMLVRKSPGCQIHRHAMLKGTIPLSGKSFPLSGNEGVSQKLQFNIVNGIIVILCKYLQSTRSKNWLADGATLHLQVRQF